MGSEWKETTLGQVVKEGGGLIQTGPFGSQLHASDYKLNGVPVIMPMNISADRVDVTDIARISRDDADRLSKHLVESGDIVYSRRGDVTLKALITDREAGMFCGTGCLLVRPGRCIDPKFLKYHLSSPRNQEWIVRHAVGATMPNLNTAILANIPLLVPSIQKAIAHILGSLDDKIELNRRMNVTLEGMAQALFKSWFVDFDPVIDNALVAGNPIPEELADRAEVRRAALANGTANREAVKQFPATFQQTEEMGWIPVGWEVSPLIEHVLLTMGQSPPSTFYNTEGSGLPFHQGVTNYGERFPTHVQFSTAGNRYAEQGDVLFSVRAPVGRINISDRKIIVGRGLSAIRHKKNLQAFLVYFLKNTFETEDSIGSGTIFDAVNKKEMENIRFLEPNNTHALQFDDIAQGFDRKIALNACESEELTKLRDTLLPKLISGKLRIPDAEKLAEAALA